MNAEKLIHQLGWRYAVKKFDPTKKIPQKEWDALEQSLVLTPSSYGLQPWKFLVVQNPDLRKRLTPASWNQTQVADASHFVVFAGKTSIDEAYIENFVKETCRVRGIPVEALSGYKKMMMGDLLTGPRSRMIEYWATFQVYIALGNLMTSAAVLGIDTCPMEGIQPTEYDKILNLEGTGYNTRVACAVGYRSPDDKYAQAAKVRFERASVVQYL